MKANGMCRAYSIYSRAEKQGVRMWPEFSQLRVGSCEHGTKPSSSREDEEFLNALSDYQLLKMDSAPWSYQMINIFLECKYYYSEIHFVK
jgi:hypothetical protein